MTWGWFGGSILFVLPCHIWLLHSLKRIGWHILWILFRFLLFMSPYFLVFLVSSHDVGFSSCSFPLFPWMTTERCLSSHRLLQSSLLWFHSSKQWNSNGGQHFTCLWLQRFPIRYQYTCLEGKTKLPRFKSRKQILKKKKLEENLWHLFLIMQESLTFSMGIDKWTHLSSFLSNYHIHYLYLYFWL